MLKNNIKYHVLLHIIVLIWGLTGILGDEISLTSSKIVFFRTGIAFVSLFLIGFYLKSKDKLKLKDILKITLIGVIVGIHWFTFFYAIKVSTVSIGVVCMSLTTLFVSFIEPIVFKRKIALTEIVLSMFILLGILIIFGVEFNYVEGILFGTFSAFMAAIFTVINGKLIKQFSSISITKYEMLGALLVSSVFVLMNDEMNSSLFQLNQKDLVGLIFLGLVCTSLAFLLSIWVMKFISPFSVSISVNMEPIYTIIIAFILNPEKETMSLGFYIGGALIITAIFTNAIIKKRKKKKNAQ